MSNAITTVILASPADKPYREQFMTRLAPYERGGVLSLWHEGMISIGGYWEQEMASAIGAAHLVLALITSSFLADRQQGEYFSAALSRQGQGLCITVSILLEACAWQYALNGMPTIMLPRDQTPITSQRKKDQAYQTVITELQPVIDRLSRRFLA